MLTSHPDPTQAKPGAKPPWVSSWSRLPSDLETVAQRTLAQSDVFDEYFSVNLGHPGCQGSPRTRLKKRDVFIVPGLLGDFDGAWGLHKGDDHVLPESLDALVAFLHRLPTPPTLIVNTGGGCHTYHLFPEPWVLTSAEDREAFDVLATRFQATVERLTHEQHGWISNGIFTADLPRVLRLPGTVNRKYHTVVTLLENTERRTTPAEISAWLDPPAARPRLTRPVGTAPIATGTLDLVRLAEHYGMALADRADGELCGAHPVHGSDTGTNVALNPATQEWHCFRYGTGGAALDFLAVCAGFLPCVEAKPGGLRGMAYVQTVTLANEEWHAGIVLDERQARREAQDAADDALAADVATTTPAQPTRSSDPVDTWLGPRSTWFGVPRARREVPV